jgi:hypothetical protein
VLTDAQLLAKLQQAELLLKNTEHGYTPDAFRWKKAMGLIDEVEEALSRPPVPPVPALGPVRPNGKSVLLHQLTHNTDGFEGVWPALDDTNVRVGTSVLAPEACKVISHHGSDGGVGFKVRGASKIVHLFLHCASRPSIGTSFIKGTKMSSVAKIRADQGGPHIHYALDTRPLIGKWLLYGRNGHGPDYTYGSPTIGQQLTKELAT